MFPMDIQAYVYSNASTVVGVEMNADFCRLQQDIVDKYQMNNRIKVIYICFVRHSANGATVYACVYICVCECMFLRLC